MEVPLLAAVLGGILIAGLFLWRLLTAKRQTSKQAVQVEFAT